MPRLRRHSVIVKANRVATIVTLVQRPGESPPQAILPIKTSRVDSCCDRLSCVLLSYNMGPEKDTVVGRVQRNIAYTTYAVFRSRYYIGSVTSWERSINSFPRKYFHFNIPNSYRFASLNMIRWTVVFAFPLVFCNKRQLHSFVVLFASWFTFWYTQPTQTRPLCTLDLNHVFRIQLQNYNTDPSVQGWLLIAFQTS